MSDLKFSHTIWGCSVHLSGGVAHAISIFSWAMIPSFVMLSIRFLSLVAFSGRVHLPFPIVGMSLGANFTKTSEWLVGTIASLVFHLKRDGARELFAYILSRHAYSYLPLFLWVWVKILWVGLSCLQWSHKFQVALILQSASTATFLFTLGGDL